MLDHVDVFIFEEIGMISAETYGVLDRVLKYVCQNDRPWGGKLVIATGDPCQLPPITGRPFFMTTHLFSFKTILMKRYVRAAADHQLQQVLEILRKNTIGQEDRQIVTQTINERSHFVETWEDVPRGPIHVVSTRRAEETVLKNLLRTHANTPDSVTIECIDEVQRGDEWIPMENERISNQLSRHVLEYKSLLIFPGAIVSMTYNDNSVRAPFSQGQLAIIENIPQDFDPSTSPVSIVLVPPGERVVAQARQQWVRRVVTRHYSMPVVMKVGTIYRRNQYPFRHAATSTIHRVMGQTAAAGLATRISSFQTEYSLWSKSQLLVVLSRVTDLQSLYFVGNREETLNAMDTVMMTSEPFDDVIRERLQMADTSDHNPNRIISNVEHPFTPNGRGIPDVYTGYVYLICCPDQPNISYVGQTGRQLRLRLREHQYGNGSQYTRGRSWALVACITGFFGPTEELIHNQRLCLERMIHCNLEGRFPWQIVAQMRTEVVAFNSRPPADNTNFLTLHIISDIEEPRIRNLIGNSPADLINDDIQNHGV